MTEVFSKSDHLGGVLSLVVSYVKQLEAAIANFTATLASTEAELASVKLELKEAREVLLGLLPDAGGSSGGVAG